ncbi:MAG: hypothetical protein JNK12_05035 [Acidimicrobiales bacterium]|nr:hypothetical protein [Acidimicrobiales bacterium]
MTDDAELWHDLVALDPVCHESPPPPASDRYAAIHARAMAYDADAATSTATATATPRPAAHSSRRRIVHPRRLAALAAAVVLVVVVAAVALGRSGTVDPASAAELVTRAARATGDATRFRGRLVVEENGAVRSSDLEVDGADIQVRGDGRSQSFTVVGDQIWEGDDPTPSTLSPTGRLAPFGSSSEAVVLAALRSDSVVAIGEEEVRGQSATHYRIELDEPSRSALGRLTPGQLAWFELEYPEEAETLDVWLGDGLIRRIEVVSQWEANETGPGDLRTTTEFYDFGAPVDIDPPG